MKKLLFALILMSSCTGLRIGQQDPLDNNRYCFINTDLWISMTFNDKHPINYYKNFDMKLDKFKVDYGKYECKELKTRE